MCTKAAFLTQVSVRAGQQSAPEHCTAGAAQFWSFTSIFLSISQCPSEASGGRRCLDHICHFQSSVLGSFQLCFLSGDKACIFQEQSKIEISLQETMENDKKRHKFLVQVWACTYRYELCLYRSSLNPFSSYFRNLALPAISFPFTVTYLQSSFTNSFHSSLLLFTCTF